MHEVMGEYQTTFDAEKSAMFNDISTHALQGVIRAVDVWPDDITKGDVILNVAMNAGYVACAEMIGILAPDLVAAEGKEGVEREAQRLWRLCARQMARDISEDQLSAGLYQATRYFHPRYRDGRSARVVLPEERGGGDAGE
jgi:hypothetical protein